MMKKEFPKDLKKYQLQSILKTVACFLIAQTAACFLFFKYSYPSLNSKNFLIHFLILFLPVFILFKLFKIPFHGVITNMEYKTATGVSFIDRLLYNDNVIILTVKTDKGKIKTFKYKSFPSPMYKKTPIGVVYKDIQNELKKPFKGALIKTFWGLREYYIKFPNGEVNCIVCGETNKADTDTCTSCGHSLIK